MNGRGADPRVAKAGAKPSVPQIDEPAGLGNTPPAQQAHDMYEGIDLTSPVMMNTMYQRYGPAFVHAAVHKHSAKELKKAAQHPDLHPRVRTILHAAAAVRKAFQSGNPLPGAIPQYPNTTPSISIPSRPRHGNPGNPENPYPSTVPGALSSAPTAGVNQAAVAQEPQTAGAASRSAGSPQNPPVANQWAYNPSPKNPVNMPTDRKPIGVGDNDDEGYANHVGQPSVGDLVHFNGPGGSAYTARVTQVTTGAVIGEFAGPSVQFLMEGITPHRVGGADHATDGSTPAGLTADAGGSGVGLGAKKDGAEFGVQKSWDGGAARADALRYAGGDLSKKSAQRKYRSFFLVCDGDPANKGSYKFPYKRLVNGKPTVDPDGLRAAKEMAAGARSGKKNSAAASAASKVKKDQRNAIYEGGQTQSDVNGQGAGLPLKSPDDGAALTPYNTSAPYNLQQGEDNGASPGNPVNGSLTARERALIARVVSHRGPMPVETAALKSLDDRTASDQQRAVIARALRSYGFAVPAARRDAEGIIEKLS